MHVVWSVNRFANPFLRAAGRFSDANAENGHVRKTRLLNLVRCSHGIERFTTCTINDDGRALVRHEFSHFGEKDHLTHAGVHRAGQMLAALALLGQDMDERGGVWQRFEFGGGDGFHRGWGISAKCRLPSLCGKPLQKPSGGDQTGAAYRRCAQWAEWGWHTDPQ